MNSLLSPYESALDRVLANEKRARNKEILRLRILPVRIHGVQGPRRKATIRNGRINLNFVVSR